MSASAIDTATGSLTASWCARIPSTIAGGSSQYEATIAPASAWSMPKRSRSSSHSSGPVAPAKPPVSSRSATTPSSTNFPMSWTSPVVPRLAGSRILASLRTRSAAMDAAHEWHHSSPGSSS